MCPWNRERVQDLAQEGWIAIWREVTEKNILADGLLKLAAINKMKNYTRWHLQECRDERNTMYPGLMQTEDGYDIIPAIEMDLTEVEDAYHDGRILEAVNRLPAKQRAYVIHRFWYGWTKKPLEIYFDQNPNDIWRYAKKNLERELVSIGVVNNV